MRKLIGICMLAVLPLLMSGCADARQVENQAYVIAMGIDRTADGGIGISAQIPKISGSKNSESGGGGKSSGDYLPISAEADSYATALEKLNWSIPRELNLSQVKIIVISKSLAEEEDFRSLIADVSSTKHIFSAASVAVYDGSAKEFVSALSPTLGTRLSVDIQSTVEHYQKLGILPECSLANLNYYTHSQYSDPMAGFVGLSGKQQKEQEAQPAAVLGASSGKSAESSSESDIKTKYQGAAVFAGGSFAGVLTGDEAIMANLLSNALDSFRYVYDGNTLELTPVGRCRCRVDTDSEQAKIHISLKLSLSGQEQAPELEGLQESLRRDIMSVISRAQDMGAEPFGFAETAARNFLTQEKWRDYNWRERFRHAQIEIKLRVANAET